MFSPRSAKATNKKEPNFDDQNLSSDTGGFELGGVKTMRVNSLTVEVLPEDPLKNEIDDYLDSDSSKVADEDLDLRGKIFRTFGNA